MSLRKEDVKKLEKEEKRKEEKNEKEKLEHKDSKMKKEHKDHHSDPPRKDSVDKKKEGSSEKKKETTLTIEEYQINTQKDCIGEGGFGVVFRGYNTQTGEFVAVKQIPLKHKKKEDIQSIKNEITLMSGLDDPHIVKYIDNKEKGGYLYIIMEYLETGSLAGLVKRYKVNEDLIAKYIFQVLEGLKYLHGEGIIHRDIKGDNVLLTKKSEIKLADFGVAGSLDDLEAQDIAGTPYWMAPEIISLNGAQYSSDIWSVGCMVIELFTGKPPYYDLPKMSALYKIVTDDHPPLPNCIDFLRKCFKKEPGLRQGAVELLKHPWLSKSDLPKVISKPKVETPKPTPIVKKEIKIEIKKEESPKKISLLDKFKEDDDSPKPKNNSISKWVDSDDEKSDTIVKGDDIAKKLKEMKITSGTSSPIKKKLDLSKFKEEDDDPPVKKVQTPPSPGTPILVREAKNKDMKKWSELKEEEDDDNLFSKLKKVEIKTKTFEEIDEITAEDFLKDEKNTTNFDIEDELKHLLSKIAKESKKEDIINSCQKLLEMYEDAQYKKKLDTLIGQICLIPIIEVLSTFEEDEILIPILKLLKAITKDSVTNQETLALIGAFPKIMKFSSYKYSKQVRKESNLLIYYMCMETKSSNGVQMFIASAGLPILSQFLKHSPIDIEKDENTREIIIRTVKLILFIINLTVGRNHKRDFCRLFSESDLIKELCNIINSIDYFEQKFWTDIFQIFYVFSTNGDSVVKLHLKKSETLKSLYSVVVKTTSEQKLLLYNTLKNLTIEPSSDHEFNGAGLLKVMVKEFDLLLKDKNIHTSQSLIQKIYFQVVNILINICVGRVVEKKEQENNIISEEAITPLLIDAIRRKLPLHDCNLRLLSKLSTGSQITKSKFLEAGGIEFFFESLTNPLFNNYQAMILDKIHAMLYNNSGIVEPILLKNIKTISSLFIDKKIELLDPFSKIIAISKKASISFSSYQSLTLTLQDWLTKIEDPNVLMKLLKILTNLFQNSTVKESFWTKDFQNTLDKLSKKGSHMVKKLVQDLIKTKENYF